MNAKDFAILRDIAADPTVALAEIGHHLGVLHTAVRVRLDKLAQRGVLSCMISTEYVAFSDRGSRAPGGAP